MRDVVACACVGVPCGVMRDNVTGVSRGPAAGTEEHKVKVKVKGWLAHAHAPQGTR